MNVFTGMRNSCKYLERIIFEEKERKRKKGRKIMKLETKYGVVEMTTEEFMRLMSSQGTVQEKPAEPVKIPEAEAETKEAEETQVSVLNDTQQYLQAFYREVMRKNSTSTARTYSLYMSTMFHDIGKEIEDITAQDVEEYTREKEKQTSEAKCSKHCSAYNYFRKFMRLEYNIMLPKLTYYPVRSSKVNPLTQGEIKKLEEMGDDIRENFLMALYIETDLTVKELSQIKLCNVYLGNGSIQMYGDNARTIFLDKETAKMMRDYMAMRRGLCNDRNEYLFAAPKDKYDKSGNWWHVADRVGENPISIDTVYTTIERIGKCAGIQDNCIRRINLTRRSRKR